MSHRLSQTQGSDARTYDEIVSESGYRIRCSIPCIVQSYDSNNNTIECQPAIREKIINPDNSTQYVNLPLLINVPVVFPHTGLYGIKFPIQKGDEVLVIFSDLSIDNFWEKGNIQNPIEARRHDLSDGIAIPCSLSLPKQGITPKVQINFTKTNIEFKTAYAKTDVSQINYDISNLKASMTMLQDRVKELEDLTYSLSRQLAQHKAEYSNHTHTVTVGDTTYTTSKP